MIESFNALGQCLQGWLVATMSIAEWPITICPAWVAAGRSAKSLA